MTQQFSVEAEVFTYARLSDFVSALDRTFASARRAAAANDNRQQIAYQIAGIASSRGFAFLPYDDPRVQLVILCGQLEMPKRYREAGSSWLVFDELLNSV